jgi:hypothetical protein
MQGPPNLQDVELLMIQCNIFINNYIIYTFFNKPYKTQEAKQSKAQHNISTSPLCTQYIMPLVTLTAHKVNIMFLNLPLTAEI